MSLPSSSRLQLTPDMSICRVLNGMWQVSGAHGRIDPQAALQSMVEYLEAGFTTWDLADHYGPAEDLIGAFRRQLIADRGVDAWAAVQALTKWVPRPGRMTRAIVEENIDISLRRMQVPCLDLMQFHWWDYRDANYLEALRHMVDLQAAGKIRHLALTNFDTEHLAIIRQHAIPIVSNQVQYSLIDQRPAARMAPFCQQQGIHLLAYGSLCGGLLSEKYLGMREPGRYDLDTASLRKYRQMIDAWGGWELFQELLTVLQTTAHKHQVSIANVAARYVLEQPAVAGVIIGARLGISEHKADNARLFSFSLDAEDYGHIAEVTRRSRDLMQVIGDCGDEYRR